MQPHYIKNTIFHALRGVIDPTVHEMEVRVAEQGYICCHALTVRAGAVKAEQFAAKLSEYVVQHNNRARIRAKHTPGSEYHKYMTERMDDIRNLIFVWASGDPEIVTACGHDMVPVQQAIVGLLEE